MKVAQKVAAGLAAGEQHPTQVVGRRAGLGTEVHILMPTRVAIPKTVSYEYPKNSSPRRTSAILGSALAIDGLLHTGLLLCLVLKLAM